VRLARDGAGKPELRGSSFRVNLAHSGEVALVAIANGREVGIDVELIRQGTQGWSLIRHALTHEERARLEGLPVFRRSEAFLWMWTRKEALLKAAGIGLAVDPILVERLVVAAR
jgi:4'-phosphopantetheinyl transferase